jgi:hypothetical protein
MFEAIRTTFPAELRASEAALLANAGGAIERGLPQVRLCRSHSITAAIAGGGPSLRATYPALDGLTFACNGAHDFLIDCGVVPYACVAMDPGQHMADVITPRAGVFYFVASTCHPALFDRLDGYDVGLWHPSGVPALDALYAAKGLLTVAGGSSVGVRAIDLCYTLGFRRFALHGLDSSYSENTHAYPDASHHEVTQLQLGEYRTSRAMIEQVHDFFERRDKWTGATIVMHGDGLLQDEFAAEALCSSVESEARSGGGGMAHFPPPSGGLHGQVHA